MAEVYVENIMVTIIECHWCEATFDNADMTEWLNSNDIGLNWTRPPYKLILANDRLLEAREQLPDGTYIVSQIGYDTEDLDLEDCKLEVLTN